MPPDDGSPLLTAKGYLAALETLVSQEAESFTSTLMPAMVTAEEYDRLAAILKKLKPDNGHEDGGNAELSPIVISDDGPGPKRRGRPSKKGNESPQLRVSDSWKGLRHLVTIELDAPLKLLLDQNPSREAAHFLRKSTIALPNPAEQDTPSTKVLAKLCISLDMQYTSSVLPKVRWLFDMLALGDMIVLLYGQAQVSRMSSTMKKEVQGAVPEPQTNEDLISIKEMLPIACNVVFICEHFGTGSLFWLRSKLTKDVLKNKITKDGTPFQDTKDNFTQRGFHQEIEDSGANQLGDAIRAYLRGVYKIDAGLDTTATEDMEIEATGGGSSA